MAIFLALIVTIVTTIEIYVYLGWDGIFGVVAGLILGITMLAAFMWDSKA